MTADLGELDRRSGALWAITSFFNPMGYRRRLANFRVFRERLGIPLVAVELAYGDAYELGEGDAEILVRRRGTDVLWQKERLLNLALEALPAECTKVAWIDCDVFFENPDWHLAFERVLDEVPIAQAFSQVAYLSRDWTPASSHGIAFRRRSRTAVIGVASSPQAVFENPDRNVTGAPGFAWGARRELLDRHRFYDAGIVGGGDRLIVCAAYDYLAGAQRVHHEDPVQRAHYLHWAEPLAEEVAGRVGCLDAGLCSLWHGDMADRRLDERFIGLRSFGFDPMADIAVDAGGAWRWASDKPALHAYVRDYFAARREDG